VVFGDCQRSLPGDSAEPGIVRRNELCQKIEPGGTPMFKMLSLVN
jgi:hypothetical protein